MDDLAKLKIIGMVTVLLVLVALVVAGCEQDIGLVENETDKTPGLGRIRQWTDPTTGCVYYIRNSDHRGGITIRYNSDGTPDCPKGKSK